MTRKLATALLASFLSLFSFVFPAAASKQNFCGNASIGDIVLYNSGYRTLAVWCDGNPIFGEMTLGPWSSDWNPFGVANFNGGPSSDVMVINTTTHDVSIWPSGNAAAGYISGNLNTAAGYQMLQSFGDFNGDGSDDLIVYNTAQVAIWYSGMASTSTILGALTPGWVPFLVADVNGDGFADLVLRQFSGGSPTGAYSYWLGGNPAASAMIASPGVPWEIMAMNNFVTGAPSCDILWYSVRDGAMATSVGCTSPLTSFTDLGLLGWPIFPFMAEDITGDGKADLVSEHPNTTEFSYMGGGVVSTTTYFATYNRAAGWNPFHAYRVWYH